MGLSQEELREILSALIHEAQRVRADRILADQWHTDVLTKRLALLIDVTVKVGDLMRQESRNDRQ